MNIVKTVSNVAKRMAPLAAVSMAVSFGIGMGLVMTDGAEVLGLIVMAGAAAGLGVVLICAD